MLNKFLIKKIAMLGFLTLLIFSYASSAFAFNPLTSLINAYKNYLTPPAVVSLGVPKQTPKEASLPPVINVIGKPVYNNSISESVLLAQLEKLLNRQDIQNKLRGPQGQKGDKGDVGSASGGGYTPIPLSPTPAYVGVSQPNPATNFAGATYLNATNLSSNNLTTSSFTTSQANITNLNVSESSIFKDISVSGNATIAGNLDVAGTAFFTKLKFVDGNQAVGKYLISDVDGNASWADVIGGSSQWVTSGNDIYYNIGNVGIGTTAPSAKLEIVGSSLVTGSELITGGDFTGGIDLAWTTGNDVAYGTNNVVSTYTGGDPSLSTTFSSVAGTAYVFTFTISDLNAPMYFSFDNNTVSENSLAISSNGTQSITFISNFTGTDTILFDDWNYVIGDTWTLDSVSIKEKTPDAPAIKVVDYNGATLLKLGGDTLQNTAIGSAALGVNTTGTNNTANGYNALKMNTIGNDNTATGANALYSNSWHQSGCFPPHPGCYITWAGRNNTANGASALYSSGIGNDNTAVGYHALYSNAGTISFGPEAATVSGSNNTAAGSNSLQSNITGSNNTANGTSALYSNSTGNSNTANGYNALYYNTADNNTAVGVQALGSNSTGFNNTALGYGAGDSFTETSNTMGDNSVFLGYNAKSSSDGQTNQIVIGSEAIGIGSNSVVLGNYNIVKTLLRGNVGIGTINPSFKLDVLGSSRFTGSGTSVLTGNVDPTASTNVIGVNTLFFSELVIGDRITVSGETRTVTDIMTDTNLTVDTAFSDNINDTSPYKLPAILVVQNSLGWDKMVMNDLGNVGIGTTAPGQRLSVLGDTGDTAVVDIATTGGNTCTFSTTTGSFSCVSDLRLKHDINTISNSLSKISLLNPVTYHYNWQTETEPLVSGFIAQEFEKVFPEMVSTDPVTGYKSLSYAPLLPYAIGAIEEMNLNLDSITGTITPLAGSASENFATAFFKNILAKVTAFLADANNGITDMFAETYHAKTKICINQTCVDENQLKTILQNNNLVSIPTPDPAPVPSLVPLTCTAPQILNVGGDVCVDPVPSTPTLDLGGTTSTVDADAGSTTPPPISDGVPVIP